MSIDVLSVIREQRLTAIRRSLAQTERHEKDLHQRGERATAIVNGTSPHSGKQHFNEYVMRDLYNKELENYTRERVFSSPELNPRAVALWGRVVKAWQVTGVDMETYLKAQFTYFHNVFRTHPTPVQCTTEGAIVRAASVVPEKVMTNNIAFKIETSELFRCCEKQMTEIMRAQNMTREEVYRKLVLTRMIPFPEQFLKADPTWKKVCEISV